MKLYGIDRFGYSKDNADESYGRPIALREMPVSDTSNQHYSDEESENISSWKSMVIEHEKENSPNIMKEEQFTGKGDEDWKNPDAEWMTSMNGTADGNESSCEDSSMKSVKNELEIAWFRVVGDPAKDGMDESKLRDLCAELGLKNITKPEDISELFEALDDDSDGLVMFHEFYEQMSVFLGCPPADDTCVANTTSDLDLSPNENNEFDCLFDKQNENIDGMKDKPPNIPMPMHSSSHLCENEFDQSMNHDVTPTKSDSDVLTSSTEHNSLIEETKSHSPSMGRLSLESDTSPLCPPVVSVEPRQLAAINKGRRRRRYSAVAASNPASARQQRKKSSRAIPLPHYHPTSIRRVEELPLSYLSESNGRYVSLDTLRNCWEMEGLENSSDVLDALQLTPNEESISIEALSEVFEMEFDQNLIEKAALVLYKRGIKHYRALNSHGEAERTKHVNKINLLASQLQEQEERIEKVESNYTMNIQEKETRHKNDIRALTRELAEMQSKIKEFEDASLGNQHEEIESLTKKYEEVLRSYEELKQECQRLAKLLEETEVKLLEAEEAKKMMLEEIEAARSGLVSSNEILTSQRTRNSEIFELWKLNKEEFRVMQDRHDELLDRLHRTGRRWTSPSQVKSSTRVNGESPGTGDFSTYTTASEELPRFSSCQAWSDSGTPRHHGDMLTSSPHFKDRCMSSTKTENDMTSISTFRSPKRVLLSHEFAFLSPSSTQSVSRIRHPFSTVTTSLPNVSESSITL